TQAQKSFWEKSDTLNIKRRNAVVVTETVLATGTLFALNELWYKDYPRSSFQFKNDNNDWKQMDKAGHLMTSYYFGKIGMETLDWAGVSKKNQLIYGATLGFTFLTAVEILDGFSQQWGASLGDVVANATGTGLLVGQELLWNEQRIKVKYSFHQTKYATQRPETLGEGFLQQTIKDYNGQTYWLSANLWSFDKEGNFPKWLNIAFGYGADGMLFGNNSPTNSLLQNPYRQFYLSLDADLTKINTKSKFLKTCFSVINFIKIPAPALEFNTKNGFKVHYLYF
ncbi:YfiM family protein, partial [Polaribacter sp.]|nr:YfiM family protein [Polaribacter sp.]